MRFWFLNQFCPLFPSPSFSALHLMVTCCKCRVTQRHCTGWFCSLSLCKLLYYPGAFVSAERPDLLPWGYAISSELQKGPKGLPFVFLLTSWLYSDSKKEGNNLRGSHGKGQDYWPEPCLRISSSETRPEIHGHPAEPKDKETVSVLMFPKWLRGR